MAGDIEVTVRDGAVLLERCRCTLFLQATGPRRVSWRGVLYPLLADGSIDVGVAPPVFPEEPEASAPDFAVVPGVEATWVLVRGLADAMSQARARLVAGGLDITRAGRWLGAEVDGVAHDWFVRCAGHVAPEAVADLLGASATRAADDPSARLRLLDLHLTETRARLAELERSLALAGARAAHAVPAPVAAPFAAASADAEVSRLGGELADALAQVQALRARLAAAPSVPVKTRAGRLDTEVADLFAALRPDLVLLGDSLKVAFGEFSSRAVFYEALAELPPSGARPDGWKSLRGAERWWERHVSTGHDDAGRAYARFDTGLRRWSVLLSWKGEQTQDVAWIRRQG